MRSWRFGRGTGEVGDGLWDGSGGSEVDLGGERGVEHLTPSGLRPARGWPPRTIVADFGKALGALGQDLVTVPVGLDAILHEESWPVWAGLS